MTTSAINSGHAFASRAEEYEERGELVKAATAHRQAAAKFQQATNEDTETKKILDILISNHTRKAYELLNETNGIQNQVQKGSTHIIRESSDKNNNEAEYDEEDEEQEGKDPFNHFCEIVETLVDKLSNSVTEHKEKQPGVMVETKDNDRIQREMSDILDSYFVVTENTTKKEENSKKENERLKSQLNKLKKQVQALEQKSAESSLLKSSIVQFRNDVHNQAKRLRQTHEENMMSRSAIVPTSKNMKILGSSTVDMVNRVRELEEENRDIRLQNKKQEASIKKYRERWEKLKEGAKKRQPNNTNSLLKSLASNDPSLLHQ